MSDKVRQFLNDVLVLLKTILGWAKIVLDHKANVFKSKVEAATDNQGKAKTSDEKAKAAQSIVDVISTIK